MPLQIGIVGLPNVGKSTLFQALTKKQVDIANYPFATIDPNIGIVVVPDARLDVLADLSHSKKIVPAYVEFVDIAGLVKGAAEGEGLGNQFLSHIKEVDAIVEVVRAFDDPNIIHVEGAADPTRDIEILETELMLKDLETLERGVAAFERQAKAGDKKAREKLEAAKKLFESLKAGIMPKTADAADFAKELGLLSAKPILYCFNM
ncbi:MAG: GTPase, partial [Patescibacteria group bacterium]